MLEDCARLVLFDPFRHHVDDVMHHRRAQLQIEVRFDSLFRHSLGHTLQSEKRLPAASTWRRRNRKHKNACLRQQAGRATVFVYPTALFRKFYWEAKNLSH